MNTIVDRDFLRRRLRERLLAESGRATMTARQKDALLYQVCLEMGISRAVAAGEMAVLARQAREQLAVRNGAARRRRMPAPLAGFVGFFGLLTSKGELARAAEAQAEESEREAQSAEAFESMDDMHFFADFEFEPGHNPAESGFVAPEQRFEQLQDRQEALEAGIDSDARAERDREIARIRSHPEFLGDREDERFAHP